MQKFIVSLTFKKAWRNLCYMAHVAPNLGQRQTFYARLIRLITLNEERLDDAGKLARRLREEIDSLWTFLIGQGVTPTNNHAERMLRFVVLWRKRSQGTSSHKGDRRVERILSLRQTCRLRAKQIYPVLVDAMQSYFKEQSPDLSWIPQTWIIPCDRLRSNEWFHAALEYTETCAD